MADDDTSPTADRTRHDDLEPIVREFLESMKVAESGTAPIAGGGRKQFTFKVSLYLSIDDPNVPNAVRKAFAKWLNELSKFSDLKGADLQVTNCNDEFLRVPSLLFDLAFQQLTGWATVKPGKFKNVYICVKMRASIPFSRLKHRMKAYLFATNTHMQRNHSLGDSSQEMATIGYLSPVHPDLLLDNLQTELNTEIQCINAQKDDDFLAEHGIHRGVRGELVIAHGAVRGKSKQLGDVVNSQAVVVECPKNKASYYLQTVQEALRILHWSPDMRKVKFVPFALKSNQKTKEIFTKMIVYNSLENDKKAYSQILGVSRADMLEVRTLLIDQCPSITHIEPTKLTDQQGRWRIFTSKDNLDTVSNWLTENLASLVSSLAMRIPVPGFETPRLVLSNRISSLHVQDIEAIATSVPNLDDAATFPNLVIRRSPNVIRPGAWSSSPRLVPNALDASSYITGVTQPASNPSTLSASSALLDLTKQLEENREYRRNLDEARAHEHSQFQDFRESINSLRLTIEQDKAVFLQQTKDTQSVLKDTQSVLALLTSGQTGLQQSMARLELQHSNDIAAMHADIAQLTASFREFALVRSSPPLATPPRLQRTDVDCLLDSADLLASDPKRLPESSPSTSTPRSRARKFSRTKEGMATDEEHSTRQP
jgi:hypothetical protein